MLAVTRKRQHFAGVLEYAHLAQSIAAALPFPERSFDRAFAESVIGSQGTHEIKKMLVEIHRVLKPNGLFIANEAVWKVQVDPQTVAEINRACEADFGLRQVADQAWDIDDWRGAIGAAGFRICSANLLAEHLTRMADIERQSLDREHMASRLLTRFFQVRSYLSPKLIAQHTSYRKHLQKHKEDGRFVEERLFIMQKI